MDLDGFPREGMEEGPKAWGEDRRERGSHGVGVGWAPRRSRPRAGGPGKPRDPQELVQRMSNRPIRLGLGGSWDTGLSGLKQGQS